MSMLLEVTATRAAGGGATTADTTWWWTVRVSTQVRVREGVKIVMV